MRETTTTTEANMAASRGPITLDQADEALAEIERQIRSIIPAPAITDTQAEIDMWSVVVALDEGEDESLQIIAENLAPGRVQMLIWAWLALVDIREPIEAGYWEGRR
jgi:hypothetical protein